MLKRNLITYLTFAVVVSACTAQASPTPTATSQATAVSTATPTLTPAPTTTQTRTPKPPTQTLTPTFTPLPLVEPPAGLTYRTDKGLYLTEGLGNTQVLFEHDANYISLAPDGSAVLLYTDANQVLVNLATGQQTVVWPQADYNLCYFTWVNRQPLVLYTTLLPGDSDPGYSCERGSPVLLTLSGKLTVLDETGSGFSAPAVARDGQTLAYDLQGVPWLYTWQGGARQFDVAAFGFPDLGSVVFMDPSWSPSGRKLAWTYSADGVSDTASQQGLAIFDFDTSTSTLLAPYDVGGYEASRPRLTWNAAETYIALWHYHRMAQDFVQELIAVTGDYSRTLEGRLSRWSPSGDLLALRKYLAAEERWQLFIESPDGATSYPLCCGDEVLWHPDGHQVITMTFGRDGFWLIDLDSGTPVRLNLPEGATIISWESGP